MYNIFPRYESSSWNHFRPTTKNKARSYGYGGGRMNYLEKKLAYDKTFKMCVYFNVEPCNCMANDGKLRFDSGNLRTKSHLPIRALLYGDTGASVEYVNSTLGPLKCFFNTSMYNPLPPTIKIVLHLSEFVPIALLLYIYLCLKSLCRKTSLF